MISSPPAYLVSRIGIEEEWRSAGGLLCVDIDGVERPSEPSRNMTMLSLEERSIKKGHTIILPCPPQPHPSGTEPR